MPIYEYRCCCCDRCFETLVFSSSDPPPACPHCGEVTVERLLSSFSCSSSARSLGEQVPTSGFTSKGFS
jgi:putative FmdB family regulatory protein